MKIKKKHCLIQFFFLLLIISLLSGPCLAKNKINLVLIPLESPSVMYKRFLPLKRYLEKKLHISIEMRVARRSSEVVKALRDGSADIAYLCPTLYVEAHDTVDIVPLAKLKINGNSYYRSVILVREDSDIKKTIDLNDGSFVYGRYACPGSGLLPEIMLKRIGITEESMLDMAKLGSDQSAITAVLARMFDATAVADMLARSYIGKGLRPLRYSYYIPQYLFVVRSSLDSALIEKIRNTLMSINYSPDKKAILGSIGDGVDGLDLANDHDYDIVRVLMKNIDPEKNFYYPEENNYIKLFVEPVYFEPEIFVKLNPFIKYMMKKTGLSIKIIVPTTINDFMSSYKKENSSLFLANPYLLKKLPSGSGIYLASLKIKGLTVPEEWLIITNKGSNIKKLRDLEAARIGIPSVYSEGGYNSQISFMKKKGIKTKRLRLITLGSYENVIVGLYNNEVDAGFVSLTALESLKEDIDIDSFRILARVPIRDNWAVLASANIEKGFIKKLKDIITGFNNSN